MQNKAQTQAEKHILQNADEMNAEQHTLKLAYKKPAMVYYGPLAKNISLGFLSGAETDSTFAV